MTNIPEFHQLAKQLEEAESNTAVSTLFALNAHVLDAAHLVISQLFPHQDYGEFELPDTWGISALRQSWVGRMRWTITLVTTPGLNVLPSLSNSVAARGITFHGTMVAVVLRAAVLIQPANDNDPDVDPEPEEERMVA